MLNGSQRRQLDGILSVTIFTGGNECAGITGNESSMVPGQEGKWVVV